MHIDCLQNPFEETRDVIIVSVPWVDTSFSLMAPAALKPVVEKAGMTCLAVDLNGEINEKIKIHPFKHKIIKFFFDQYCDDDIEPWLIDFFESTARQIVSFNPKFVGLSAFSYVCKNSVRWLSYYIKKLNPDIKIIIGGPGCLQHALTGPSDLAQELISIGLVDYHIRGDGEHALYELLTGNSAYTGINSDDWKELSQEDLHKLPMPDYTDYNFDVYEKRILGLLGSRGCVRQCKFCDYIENWKKFTWRTADDIFEEMVNQNKKYQIRTFKFQDALTNGNLKEFNKLITLLAEYNTANPDNSFSWTGFYIFREITAHSLTEWELLSKSGAIILSVGVENLNEHIRYHMGKKFSNTSLDFHLEQAKKYNIKVVMLNIVGYISEIREDIDFAKKWLLEHTQYKDILKIQWGGTLGIFTNTYLDRHKEELGIKMIGENPQSWVNESINSTPKIRAEWAQELNEFSKYLQYDIAENLDNHYLLESIVNDKNK
jgi:radical SAM superfamily enzyme YgiQ (UPF0313 family)